MDNVMQLDAKEIKRQNVFIILKGILGALCASLILILAFALLLKFVPLSDNSIKMVNQIIKFISICYGMAIISKKSNGLLFYKGLLIGLFYGIIAFVVFSLLDWNFSVDLTTLNDIIFTTVIGGIAGVIFKVIKNKKTVK